MHTGQAGVQRAKSALLSVLQAGRGFWEEVSAVLLYTVSLAVGSAVEVVRLLVALRATLCVTGRRMLHTGHAGVQRAKSALLSVPHAGRGFWEKAGAVLFVAFGWPSTVSKVVLVAVAFAVAAEAAQGVLAPEEDEVVANEVPVYRLDEGERGTRRERREIAKAEKRHEKHVRKDEKKEQEMINASRYYIGG